MSLQSPLLKRLGLFADIKNIEVEKYLPPRVWRVAGAWLFLFGAFGA